jgi:putative DNA primase/helicase
LFRRYSDLVGLADADRKKAYFKMLNNCQSLGSLKAALGIAATDPRIRKHAEDFDADPWLFNVANGTIDLKTGELKPHNPKDYISIVVDTKYRPGARSKTWDDFFAAATSGDQEYADYVLRCVGYTMAGVVKEKCFFFPYGAPDTGKSVFFKAIAEVFGGYATSVDPSTWTTKRSANTGHADDVARLKGKRLVETDEFSAGSKFNEGLLKNITGGGEITASQKGEKTISFRPQCTIWLASNERPHIRHEDAGMWNRLRVLPFDNVIPKEEQDRSLPEKLAEPHSKEAILAACIAGCLNWQKQGITKLPAKVALAYIDYFGEMDPLKGFTEERCEFAEHGLTLRKQLYNEYIKYCEDEGIQKKYHLSKRRFSGLIKSRGAKETNKQNHAGDRYWKGITLKGELY